MPRTTRPNRPEARATRSAVLRRLVGFVACVATIATWASSVRASERSPLLFDGTTKRAWALNQSAAPDRITQLDGFAGLPGPVLRFTALDGDVAPLTPTDNPRAQLVSPLIIRPGETVWESWLMYFPADLPYVPPADWLALWTPAYGAPFDGSPPTGFQIAGSRLELGRNGYAALPWVPAWTMPVPIARWTRFTVHFDFARAGWISLYVDGREQMLSGNHGRPVRRLDMALIDATNHTGPNASRILVYYAHGAFPSVTVYYADFRVATTRGAAEGLAVPTGK
jgi:hypothetical protein